MNIFKRRNIIWGIIIVSLLIRFVNIDIPLFEAHSFRQAQTALTVQTYLYEGVSLFSYKTPVFGNPSMIPFEFPIFQMTCYFIYKCISMFFPISLDLVCRFSNLIYFYLSALILYKFCKVVFDNKNVVLYILSFYLLAPFDIFWSRTSMIDYCSVFFAFLYAFLFIQWMISEKMKYVFYTIICGILAYLVKITTVITIVPIIAYYSICYFHKKASVLSTSGRKHNILGVLIWGLCVGVPLLCGAFWTYHADQMKIISQQVWLTSKMLLTFSFGTLKARLVFDNWLVIFKRIQEYFFPGLWMGIIGFFVYDKFFNKEDKKKLIILALSIFITIMVFFNLYFVHDYYLMAVSPLISIVAGVCLYNFVQYCNQGNKNKILVTSLFLLVLSLACPRDYWRLYFMSPATYYKENDIISVAEKIKNITSRDDMIFVMDRDWNSDLLYYAERKGFMVVGHGVPFPKGMDFQDFRLVVLQDENRNLDNLSNFESLDFVDKVGKWKLYKPMTWKERLLQTDGDFEDNIFNVLELFKTYPESIKTSKIMRRMIFDNEEAVFFHPDAELVFSLKPSDTIATVEINILPEAYLDGNSDGVTFYWEAKESDEWEMLSKFELQIDSLKKDKSFRTFSVNINRVKPYSKVRLRVDAGANKNNLWDWAVIKNLELK